MVDLQLDPDHRSSEDHVERRRAETRRWGLVLLCVAAAFFAGHIGGATQAPIAWPALVANLATLVVAFIVAAALLRLIDMFALRRQRLDRVDESRAHAREMRELLEERYPDAAARARDVDAAGLVDRLLDDADAEKSSRPRNDS